MADVGAEFLFQVITERAERATVIITTFALSRGFSGRAGTPRTPLPGSTAERLTDADHFCMIRTAQRRFAPTVFGITRNSDRHQLGIGDRLRRNTHLERCKLSAPYDSCDRQTGSQILSQT